MASVYGYLTLAELELYATIDYSAKSTSYTDAVVESNITMAERYINTIMLTSFTGTIPDAVVFVATDVAYRMMHNKMLFDGIIDRDNNTKRLELMTEISFTMLKPFIVEESDSENLWVE